MIPLPLVRTLTVTALTVATLTAIVAASGCSDPASSDTTTTTSVSSGTSLVDIIEVINLPEPRLEGSLSLEQAIQKRRSIREYSAEPITLEELGQLLWATQGITSPQGARAAPSAGGTYPLELYVGAGNVTDLPPGIYHYRAQEHELDRLSTSPPPDALAAAGLDQEWIRGAPVNIVVASVYERTTGRYGERGIRYVHLEAGHAAQNLCLQATALGLGSVTVGAFDDDAVRRVMLMQADEQPLYVIPVGRPTG